MRASFFHIILVVPQQSLAVLSWRLPLQPQHLLASASRRHSYRPLMSHYPSRFATSAANSFTIYKATGWKREGFCAGQGPLFEVDEYGRATAAKAKGHPITNSQGSQTKRLKRTVKMHICSVWHCVCNMGLFCPASARVPPKHAQLGPKLRPLGSNIGPIRSQVP